MATTTESTRGPPVRRWHPSGYMVSIASSLLMGVLIAAFFVALAGWSPPAAWQTFSDFAVTWILLTYIWVQLGSLILVGAGTKNQMWVDALTSIVPLFVICYVIIQHHAGYVILSPFQARTAWVTAYTMLLDVIVDSGVSVMLSRQVLDLGHRGVL
ncbi:MAG: hypothetical protein ACOYLQ_14895 [Hyphomicrobiaceae bacterium]